MDADLDSIRTMPLDEVERWLTRVEKGQAAGPPEINQWLYLLATWNGNVRRPGSDEERVRWARVAVRVYGKLDSESASRLCSFLADQLRLRSYVIEQFGSIPGDLFFDVASVVETLRRRLPLGYEEAALALQRRRAADPADPKERYTLSDDQRRLRGTKNVLKATAQLHEHGNFQDAPDIERWFELRAALP